MGSPAAPDGIDSLKRQHSILAGLHVLLLFMLWCFHNLFVSFWGRPSKTLLALLAGAAGIRALEFFWLRRRTLRPNVSAALTSCSIGFNLMLALVLHQLSIGRIANIPPCWWSRFSSAPSGSG
jgi:hypothetical protein